MRWSEIEKYQISNQQLAFIIIQTCVGMGILSLPRVMAKTAGQDAWLAIILGAGVWAVSLMFIYLLGRRFPQDTIIQYSDYILGPYLGKLISFSYILYSTLTTAFIARTFVTVLATFNLPKTPISVTLIIFLLTSYYLVGHGLKTLARIYEFLFFVLSPAFILLLPTFFAVNWLNLQPVFQIGLTELVDSTYETMFSYIGPEIVLLIFPFIKKQDKVLASSLLGLAIVMLTYLFITVIGIGFYGLLPLQRILWPTVTLLKAIDVPFFGRLEFFFIFLWIAVAFTTVSSYFYMASYSLTQLLRFEDQRYSGLFLLPIIFGLAFIPENVLEIFNYLNFIAEFGVVLTLLVPISLLIIAKLRNIKGADQNEA
ncbi:spore germination protein [Natroniella acetigena]|uniref:GerAB/ArcD/ProY family transporter n=1 Tax=Natroniella acetigena TaxID=52004 RepID=UPI00200A53B4|nr:GerAB/ArcD/ProY family transporter [Natroniella acetigena]MCK8828293.1 spore germination protein [Natroniella acetigena]